jgi:hypothetical protein
VRPIRKQGAGSIGKIRATFTFVAEAATGRTARVANSPSVSRKKMARCSPKLGHGGAVNGCEGVGAPRANRVSGHCAAHTAPGTAQGSARCCRPPAAGGGVDGQQVPHRSLPPALSFFLRGEPAAGGKTAMLFTPAGGRTVKGGQVNPIAGRTRSVCAPARCYPATPRLPCFLIAVGLVSPAFEASLAEAALYHANLRPRPARMGPISCRRLVAMDEPGGLGWLLSRHRLRRGFAPSGGAQSWNLRSPIAGGRPLSRDVDRPPLRPAAYDEVKANQQQHQRVAHDRPVKPFQDAVSARRLIGRFSQGLAFCPPRSPVKAIGECEQLLTPAEIKADLRRELTQPCCSLPIQFGLGILELVGHLGCTVNHSPDDRNKKANRRFRVPTTRKG